ncbi:MAG: aldehyde ferredoxin oxidoreductase, partial [Candidatus Heimdallarchaeota archaeon]|nr:aldehyde ferredoxin oxidoreductase [Candidatus Heimdallarchaeota archaeon]
DGKNWDRKMDYPPARWLNEGVKNAGPHTGKHLDVNQYDGLLDHYYELREWDDRGIPTRSLMDKLGLSQEAEELNAMVELK